MLSWPIIKDTFARSCSVRSFEKVGQDISLRADSFLGRVILPAGNGCPPNAPLGGGRPVSNRTWAHNPGQSKAAFEPATFYQFVFPHPPGSVGGLFKTARLAHRSADAGQSEPGGARPAFLSGRQSAGSGVVALEPCTEPRSYGLAGVIPRQHGQVGSTPARSTFFPSRAYWSAPVIGYARQAAGRERHLAGLTPFLTLRAASNAMAGMSARARSSHPAPPHSI